MKQQRLSIFAASATVASLSLLAGCGADDDAAPANSDGSPVGGTSAASGGSGGVSSVGAVSGAGSGGASSAGVGGASPMAGAAGNGSSSAIPATFATIKLVLGGGGGIMPCAAAPCHGVGGMAPPGDPLELPSNNDQQLYANLTTHVSRACNNTKLVTAGNPAQSALVTILKGPCGMTPCMPYGCSAEAGDCIPDDYIAAVEQWIAGGAPQR